MKQILLEALILAVVPTNATINQSVSEVSSPPTVYVVEEIQLVETVPVPELKKLATVKPIIIKPPEPPRAPRRAHSAPAGWYPRFQCTWYVASRRAVGAWNDAIRWPAQALADGWTVSRIPVRGAIGQQGNHVVYIEKVEGSRVYLSERNYDYNGSYRERWAPASDFTYIY